MGLFAYARQEKYFLSIVFLLSLLIRLSVFAYYTQYEDRAWLAFDSEQYHQVAVQIAKGNGISTKEGTPNLYRLPGYPLFLATGYKLFNFSTQSALWIQVCLASLIPILLFFFILTLFPMQVTAAKVASVIALLHVGFIFYAGIVATESLFLVFFLLFLICFFVHYRLWYEDIFYTVNYKSDFFRNIHSKIIFLATERHSRESGNPGAKQFSGSPIKSGMTSHSVGAFSGFERLEKSECNNNFERWLVLFLAGFFLGVASLIRAVGHYVLVIALCLILLSAWRLADKIKAMIILFLSWLLVVGAWLVRNYVLTGAIFFHTLPGLHFLQYSAVYVVMDLQRCDYFKAKKIVFAEWDKEVAAQEQLLHRPVTEYERYAIAEQLAKKYLFNNPIIALKHALIQIARTCGTLYSTILLYVPLGTVYPADAGLWFKMKLYLFPRAISSYVIPFIYLELILFFLMWLGVVLFLYQALYDCSWQLVLIKVAPFLLMLLTITLAYGCARLRFAAEPFLIILASYAWARYFENYL